MRKGYVSPSLMCVDLMNVQSDIEKLEKVGVDYFHVDMMDNHFVPNITLSTDFIKALKKISKTPLDIHMMIEHPEQTIPELTCCDENDIICIHYESTIHPQKALAAVREMGVKAGLAINPATPICVLEDLLPDIDMVLCMTVNPGFAGQKLIPATLNKITRIRKMLNESGYPDTLIEVDGNVSFENAVKMHEAGADIYVAGTSSVFARTGTLEENLKKQAAALVTEECHRALTAIEPEKVLEYLDMLTSAKRVFFVGVGRVLLSLEAIAKRYAHLGIDTVIVGQITEPAITKDDVLVVGSGSGETMFPAGIARKAKAFGAKVIHIGSNPNSGLKDVADLFVRIPVESRAKAPDEIHSVQPMTSLFEQSLLLFGDTTALMLVKEKHLELDKLWEYHANLE